MGEVLGPIDLGDWRLMSTLNHAILLHEKDSKFQRAVGKWKALYDHTKSQYKWRGCCDQASHHAA